MLVRFKNSKLPIFLSATLIGNAIFLILSLLDWPLLRITKMRGPTDYQDLYAVFKYKKCFADFGYSLTDRYLHQDCSGFIYNFQLLKALNLEFISKISPLEFQILQVTLYSTLFSFIFTYMANTNKIKLLTLFLLVSPSSQLLIERGNFDALMIPIIVFSAIFIYEGKIFQGALLIITGAMLKFYSLPLFLYVIQQSQKVITKIVVSIVFLITALISIHEYQLLRDDTLRTYCCSYGNDLFGLYLIRLGMNINQNTVPLIGLMFLILLTFILNSSYHPRIKSLVPEIEFSRSSEFYFFSSLILIFFSLYFAGTNFDYRLQILSIAQLVYINSLCEDLNRRAHVVFFFLIQIFSYPSMDLQPVGDILITIYLASYLTILPLFIKTLRKPKVHQV